ncbi:unnamed protein product [Caenorhabditis sp. 36 PRJEB53466]|nr:unnamed protein product [Caenorhabditis sp. 36 PRJEB53466]
MCFCGDKRWEKSPQLPFYGKAFLIPTECTCAMVIYSQHHKLHFDDINVEKFHNHLSFYDGFSSETPLIKKLSGTQKNTTFSSSSDVMFVPFSSDVHGTKRGFHFNVFAVPNELSTNAKVDSSGCWHPHLLFLLFLIVHTVVVVLKHPNSVESTMAQC